MSDIYLFGEFPWNYIHENAGTHFIILSRCLAVIHNSHKRAQKHNCRENYRHIPSQCARPFFCNPITPSRLALVYLSTWFLGHGPWITQPPSRVHLTVWHHLSTFIDIHFLQWKITAKQKALPPWCRSYFSYFVIPLLEGRAGERVDSLENWLSKLLSLQPVGGWVVSEQE